MLLKELLDSLTKEQAAEYAAETDQYLWVMDNITDPLGLPEKWISAIEDKFDEMNKKT